MDINGFCYPTGDNTDVEITVSIHFTQHGSADVRQLFLSSAGRMHMTRAVRHGKVMRPLMKTAPSSLPSCFENFH